MEPLKVEEREEINIGQHTMSFIVRCEKQISWELIRGASSKTPRERIGKYDEHQIGFFFFSALHQKVMNLIWDWSKDKHALNQ